MVIGSQQASASGAICRNPSAFPLLRSALLGLVFAVIWESWIKTMLV
jgi:hypothetical protein